MTRIFIPENNFHGDYVRIEGEDAHYLTHVLRLKVGDSFQVIVPTATEYTVLIGQVSGDCVEGRVTQVLERDTEPHLALTLYQAVLKGKNFSLVIQKTVELGVGIIVPMITHRTVVRLPPRAASHRRQRWQRIAEQAAEQSERMSVPQVQKPLSFQHALEHWQASGAPGLIFAARAAGNESCNLRAVLSQLRGTNSLALFVGPEGGFSGEETHNAVSAGLREASLGRRILRAETAAVLACGLCMYELDELIPPDPTEASVDQ